MVVVARVAKRARREALRVLAVVSLVSFVATLALAGHRYFYCAHMHEVSLDPCCASTQTASQLSPAVTKPDPSCCRASQFSTAEAGVLTELRLALRTPRVERLAYSPLGTLSAPSSLAWTPAGARASPRDGPGSRRASTSDYRIRLMVSLT